MEPLCEYCNVIPLTYSEITAKSLTSDISDWFNLGELARINTSKCPFCRLVAQAIHEDYKATRPEDGVAASRLNPVNLFWSEDTVPDGKGAFVIYGVRSCVICLASDDFDAPEVHNTFCLRTVVKPELDYPRMANWISTCAETHTVSCGSRQKTSISFAAAYPGLNVLRLIDVEENRLIEACEVLPYVALSYVWGGIPTIRLTRTNLEAMLLPGSLNELWLRLPRTIQDTLCLVRELGLRYVWVDALCLVQNDPEDLERGIKVMDNIYEESKLTIIAAAGHNARAGLPGVRGNSRLQAQTMKVKKSTYLGVFVGLDQLLQSTVYQSRAWTFQEQLLCRRAMIFVDNQVFFRCRQSTLSERTSQDLPNPPLEMSKHGASQNLVQLSRLKDPVKNYAGVLEHYTARALTNQGDALHGLAGTMRRVGQKLGQEIVQGLPSGEIDSFLLFRSASGGGFSSRRRGFPSWSWAGWEQAVTFGYDDIVSNWPESQNWIVWYEKARSGATRLLSTYSDVQSDHRSDLSSRKYEFGRRYSLDIAHTAPTQHQHQPIAGQRYSFLQFWTLAVYYDIRVENELAGIYTIHGKDSSNCGIIRVDGLESGSIVNGDHPLEFILLSEHSDDGQDEGLDAVYTMMLLENHDGFAERRGLGYCSLSRIGHSYPPGPLWKEIILG